MRKIVLQEFGEPEVLRVEDHPEPCLPADGYVVELRGIGINYADVVLRRGRYRRDQQAPCEIGFEASGVVVARGAEAHGFEEGDPVVVVKLQGGCYAERVAVGPDEILPARRDIELEQLAGYPNTFATAWYALQEIGRLQAGESVLIQAGAGGVGSAAVQLARAMGCSPVLATAGSAEKCRWVEGLGADACIDYRSSDFREAVWECTDGRGVDFVLESVGGEVFERSLEVLAPLGLAVVIGFSAIESDYADAVSRVHPLSLFQRSISLSGLNIANLCYPRRRHTWRALDAFCTQHGLGPQIGGRFALEDAPLAHAELEARRSKGKLLLIP